MAWSDAARAAAALARKRTGQLARGARRRAMYEPPGNRDKAAHVPRSQMAQMLREARSNGRDYRGNATGSMNAVDYATAQGRYFTNVKGAHFVDQGRKGLVWRSPSGKGPAPKGGVPKWAAKSVKFTRR